MYIRIYTYNTCMFHTKCQAALPDCWRHDAKVTQGVGDTCSSRIFKSQSWEPLNSLQQDFRRECFHNTWETGEKLSVMLTNLLLSDSWMGKRQYCQPVFIVMLLNILKYGCDIKVVIADVAMEYKVSVLFFLLGSSRAVTLSFAAFVRSGRKMVVFYGLD